MLSFKNLDHRIIFFYAFFVYLLINGAFLFYFPYQKPLMILFWIGLLILDKTHKKYLIMSGLFALFLALEVYLYYFYHGNHKFLGFYLSVLMFLSFIATKEEDFIKNQSKFMLSFIMAVAVTQKLFVKEYTSGEYLNYMFMSGYFFEPLKVFEAYATYVNTNKQLLTDLLTIETVNKAHVRYFFPNQLAWFKLFSWLIIVSELAFVGLLFLKNKAVKYVSILIILVLIGLTIKETGFLAFLFLMLFLTLDKQDYVYKYTFLSMYLITLVLIVTKIGYH